MKRPVFRRSRVPMHRSGERGITMILVALSMVALIAMAALSIDVVTLYLAREEAQRAADAAALAAARVISVSGITGGPSLDTDPAPWTNVCGGATSVASLTAQAVAQENAIGSSVASAVNVTYSSGSGAGVGTADCTAVPGDAQFGVNPLVTVKVTRNSLPTLFSRIWSRGTNSVSATATAEVFNPSGSGTYTGGQIVPVTPRCVKPWIIPNVDPFLGAGNTLVNGTTTGAISNPSIVLNGSGAGIGEKFTLTDACSGADCSNMGGNAPSPGSYIPAFVSQASIAYPTCADDSYYQQAIGGCDMNTVYACGASGGSTADLTINPGGSGGDTSTAAQCLIRQSGQDSLDTSRYPFQISAGPNNPIVPSPQLITASDNIVTLPIYDGSSLSSSSRPAVTIVGFLQVFIDHVDPTTGNPIVYVLNVAGCGNAASTTRSAPGTSPVPIRLITP